MKKIIRHLQEEWYRYVLEIFVLIIGIYGAFAVDNWNENRKDKEKENKVLVRLKGDFETDLEQLESRISLRKLVIQSAQQAVDYIDEPNGVPIDSIYRKVSALFYTATFDPIEHKLMESGDIHLIKNEELKHLLATWPSYLVQLTEVEFEYLNTYRNIIIPFFVETGLGRGIDHAIWTDDKFHIKNYWIGNVATDSTIVKKPIRAIDPKITLKNQKLESLLTNAITINTVCQIEAAAVKKRIEKIIQLLEENIQ